MNRSYSTLAHIAAFATLTVALLAAASAFAQTTDAGGLLRDKTGKTLYTFDKDSGGESHCFDGCAAAWPPFMAADGAQAKDKLTLAIALTDFSVHYTQGAAEAAEAGLKDFSIISFIVL